MGFCEHYLFIFILQKVLGEFPEKELQLHQTEAQGQLVLSKTSEEGSVHIQRDLKGLRESWMSLHTLSLNLYRSDTEKNTVLILGVFYHFLQAYVQSCAFFCPVWVLLLKTKWDFQYFV